MVNNNGMPIEINKKPFELVQELKDEYKALSYEEFMKNYESDGEVSYEDLNGGSVGEFKGYGPCYKNCGWNNPYCSCQEWTDLYMSCPASGCVNSALSYWTHEADGGILEISDHANIRCKNCGVTDNASKWPFPICSNHRGVYKQVVYDSFLRSLNLSFKSQENKKVMRKALLHLFDYREEWDI